MVIGQITKQQRKAERQELGKLRDLVVKKGTLEKYHSHFNRFCDWAEANGFPLLDPQEFDAAASQFIESLWADGFGKAEGSYLLAALQFMLPVLKHNLVLSWRLMKTWTKHELPTRAVPLDARTALAFAGLFWVWGEHRMAAGILVAFDFFLRTGELFTLRRIHVEFFAQQATIQLTQTKSSTHQIHSQRLLAWDRLCVASLKFLCHDLLPSDYLVPSSAVRFRILWHRAVRFFDLSDFYIQPYSLRRGGCTSAFRAGVSFEQLLVRGRWTHQRTARIYIDEALQQSASLNFPPCTQHRLRWARSQFPLNGFAILGTRGMVGGEA